MRDAAPQHTVADPVGIALSSIGAGATSGAVLMTGGVGLVRYLQAGGAPQPGLAFGIFLGTALGGVAAAAAFGWVHTRRIDDRWRRGVTAAVSVLGAVLLAIVAIPVDLVADGAGLGIYVVALAAALSYFHRAAARAGAR
jgi:hypothetical protein